MFDTAVLALLLIESAELSYLHSSRSKCPLVFNVSFLYTFTLLHMFLYARRWKQLSDRCVDRLSMTPRASAELIAVVNVLHIFDSRILHTF